MARAYKIVLEPEDIDTRTVYFIEGDFFDGEPELTVDNSEDILDGVLSDNDGYYVDSIESVDIETARQNHPYEV